MTIFLRLYKTAASILSSLDLSTELSRLDNIEGSIFGSVV